MVSAQRDHAVPVQPALFQFAPVPMLHGGLGFMQTVLLILHQLYQKGKTVETGRLKGKLLLFKRPAQAFHALGAL